jgi:hypothetical protein
MICQEIQLAPVGVRRVDHGRARTEKPGVREELDRTHPVLHYALLDLARLLVGVDVERQLSGARVLPDFLKPPSRHRPDAVRRRPDFQERTRVRPPPERVNPFHERGHGRVAEAWNAAPGVGTRQQEEPDAGVFGGLCHGFR